MTDDPDQLTEALLAQDRPPRDDPAVRDAWLASVLEREEVMERRVRRAATGTWIAVAALVPLLVVSIFMVQMVSDGWTRDAVRGVAIVVGVFTILAIFVAMLATVAWLFRRRTGSLAAVERRLAALELLLMEAVRRSGR